MTTCSLREVADQYDLYISALHRSYSWTSEQWSAFLDDLERVTRTAEDWCIGPLILRADPADTRRVELIDGYQRWVTLLLVEGAFQQQEASVGADPSRQALERCDWGSDHAFITQLLSGTQTPHSPATRSEQLLLAAWQHIHRWMDSLGNHRHRVRNALVHQVRLGLCFLPRDGQSAVRFSEGMIGHAPTELQQILMVFSGLVAGRSDAALLERIASTGQSVRHALGRAGLTGPEDEDKLFRTAFQVAFQAGEVRVRTAIPWLRARYRPGFDDAVLSEEDRAEILEFLEMMESFARHLVWIYRPEAVDETEWPSWPGFRFCLEPLGRMPDSAATWALVLPLLTWMTNNESDTEGLARGMELLRLIQTAHFRLSVLPRDRTRGRQPAWYLSNLGFTLWHHRRDEPLYTEDSDLPFGGDILEWILQDLLQLVHRQGGDERVMDALTLAPGEDFSFFWWTDRGLAWFLAEYEQHLRDGQGPPFLLTERQASREDLDRKTPGKVVLGELWRWEDQAERFGYTHHEKQRLGNFFLRDLTMDDRHPAVGLSDYCRVLQDANAALRPEDQLVQVAELAGILVEAQGRLQAQGLRPDQYPDLPRAVCDLREERMIRFALARWGISTGEVMKNSSRTVSGMNK